VLAVRTVRNGPADEGHYHQTKDWRVQGMSASYVTPSD